MSANTKGAPDASFSKNVGRIFVSKVILIFLKMASSILTSRYMGPVGRGIYVMVAQVPGFFTMFSNLSIGEALSVFVGRKTIARNEVFASTISLLVISACTTMVAYFFGLPLLQKYFWKDTPAIIGILSGFMIPAVLAEYYCLFSIRGAMEFKLLSRLSIFSRVFLLASMFVSLALFKFDTVDFIWAFICSQLALSLVYIVATAWVSNFQWKLRAAHIRQSVKYGALVHVSTLLSDMEYRSDIYLMAFFLSPKEIGLYSIGVTVAQISWYLTNSVNTVFLPKVSSLEGENAQLHSNQICRVSLFITLMMNVGLALCGYFLIWGFYGVEFIPSYWVLLLLLPGITCDSVYRILSSYFKAQNLLGLLNRYSIISLGLNVGLNLVLIPRWGIEGAAVSSSISYSLKAFLVWRVYLEKTNASVAETIFLSRSDLSKLMTRLTQARSLIRI